MKILFFILLILTCSCSTKRKDTQFCACLKAGNELNTKTASILQKEVNQQDKIEIMQLKGKKERACENFKLMSGPEMRAKMADCFRN